MRNYLGYKLWIVPQLACEWYNPFTLVCVCHIDGYLSWDSCFCLPQSSRPIWGLHCFLESYLPLPDIPPFISCLAKLTLNYAFYCQVMLIHSTKEILFIPTTMEIPLHSPTKCPLLTLVNSSREEQLWKPADKNLGPQCPFYLYLDTLGESALQSELPWWLNLNLYTEIIYYQFMHSYN